MQVSVGQLGDVEDYLRNCLLPACEIRREAYSQYGFGCQPIPSYADWVVFCAALTGSPISPIGERAALDQAMVTAAQSGRPFPYMYDWEYGKDQQMHDERIDHLFVSFTDDLIEIDVRRSDGRAVVDRFKSEWGDPIGVDCQPSDASFDLPYDWVRSNAETIARFVAGTRVFGDI